MVWARETPSLVGTALSRRLQAVLEVPAVRKGASLPLVAAVQQEAADPQAVASSSLKPTVL